MSAEVIQLVRRKDVTGWSVNRIREWCRAHGWEEGFKIDLRRYGQGEVIIERLRRER